MTFENAKEWLRRNGTEVKQLADRGHNLAQMIVIFYIECYERQKLTDRQPFERAKASLLAALEDFIRQDLTIHSRTELKAKYGYKDDEKPAPATSILQH